MLQTKRLQITPMTRDAWLACAEACLTPHPTDSSTFFYGDGALQTHQVVGGVKGQYASGGYIAEIVAGRSDEAQLPDHMLDHVVVRLLREDGIPFSELLRIVEAAFNPYTDQPLAEDLMEAYRVTYTQRGEERDYFMTHVPASALVPSEDGTTFTIDQLSPTNPDGYQRAPAERRFKGFSDFLQGEGNESGFIGNPLPQPIVLNAREALTVKLIEGSENFAHITLPGTLYIVDGQHRRGGTVQAVRDLQEDDDLRDHMIPLVIMNGMSREEEAVLFYVINHTMVKVPVDVAQRIAYHWTNVKGINSDTVLRSWMPKAIELIDGLNGNPKSVWHKRVKTPGSSVRGGVSQGAFIRSLDALLKSPKFGNAPTVKLLKLMIAYWNVIKDLVPEAFETPRKHLIQKTTGLTVMNRLLPVLDGILQTQGKPTNPMTLRELLTVVLEDGSAFWESKVEAKVREPRAARYGTNNKGFTMLAEFLQETKLTPLMQRDNAVFEDFDEEEVEEPEMAEAVSESVEEPATETVVEEVEAPETEVAEEDDLPPAPTLPEVVS